MPSSYVIGDHFEAFVREQVRLGRYASASEVIRDGLRALEDRQKFQVMKLKALRAEVKKGADSGKAIAAEKVFSEARERIRKVAAAGLVKR